MCIMSPALKYPTPQTGSTMYDFLFVVAIIFTLFSVASLVARDGWPAPIERMLDVALGQDQDGEI